VSEETLWGCSLGNRSASTASTHVLHAVQKPVRDSPSGSLPLFRGAYCAIGYYRRDLILELEPCRVGGWPPVKSKLDSLCPHVKPDCLLPSPPIPFTTCQEQWPLLLNPSCSFDWNEAFSYVFIPTPLMKGSPPPLPH